MGNTNLKEKENYKPNDRTENVSLDVRGHFYAGWGSCPYRQKDANLAFQSNSRHCEKGIWPSNLADLNPNEIIWAIIQADLNKMGPATNLSELANYLKSIWNGLTPSILENLISGTPLLKFRLVISRLRNRLYLGLIW